MSRSIVALALGASLIASTASAQVFSGFDFGGGVGGPRTNSDNAHLAWLAAAGAPSATETFEGIPLGSTAPIGLAGGMTLSTVNATPAASGLVNQVTNDQSPEIGYNSTIGGSRFYRFTTSDVGQSGTLTFSFLSPVSAFGVYVTGIQTFYGTTTATWGASSFVLANTSNGNASSAGIQFFGFVTPTAVSSVTFTLVDQPAIRDIAGYDDIQFVNAAVVPEPATVALLGGGLLALGAAARRRRA